MKTIKELEDIMKLHDNRCHDASIHKDILEDVLELIDEFYKYASDKIMLDELKARIKG